jgi:glycosyltransferase involved in cell wall biosynthesis
MKILHVVALIHASTGGPAVSVTRLATEQVRLGHDVALACLEYPHLGANRQAPGVRIEAIHGGEAAVRLRGWSPALRRLLMNEARRADVVHNHGLWMWPNAYARQAAVSAGRPLVVSPRGMLDDWSLRRSRLKKALAWWIFERRNLQAARLLHATSEAEVSNVRCMGLGQRVVLAPNGVDLPDMDDPPARGVLEASFPLLRGRRWVAFLSRLHPKKGLDILLEAWRRQAPLAGPRPVLVIAGPDLTGYGRDVERMVSGMEDSVVLTGELRGERKDCLLANADVFVLPSYSENFGIVVAEAMAWGRPVITTTTTPWAEIAKRGAGWWVRPEAREVGEAVRRAMGKTPAELAEMGLRGRALVAENYGWPASAAKLTEAYAEVLLR